MQIITTTQEMINIRNTISANKTVGFVPTMGALHQGHQSLIEKSKNENDITILSIFVNPTQFNNQNDLKHYPRNTDQDAEIAKELEVDYVFMPSDEAMYPNGYSYQINTSNKYSLILEGESRPGHFSGVLTVVNKLLHLTRPNKAYFGEKDYQQVKLVEGLVKDSFISTEIISCPIVREPSGLPLSSRNENLSPEEKKTATEAFTIIHQINSKNIDRTIEELQKLHIKIDYITVIDGRLFIAIYVGNTRLIDNFTVAPEH